MSATGWTRCIFGKPFSHMKKMATVRTPEENVKMLSQQIIFLLGKMLPPAPNIKTSDDQMAKATGIRNAFTCIT